MNLPIRPKLKDLRIGDRFHEVNDIKKPVYEVTGKIEFITGTRMCTNLHTGKEESKSGVIEVIKLSYCLECGTNVENGNLYCKECETI